MPGTETTDPRPQRLGAAERRRQIVGATIVCLARNGPERWTLRQVSREAGVAPSLVTHFFQSWNDLLLAAYRDLAERFEDEFSGIEARADLTPRARLDFYVERYFSDRWISADIAGAYIAFWTLGRSEPRLQVEMDRVSEMMRGTLLPLVAACVSGRGGAKEGGQAALIGETFHFLLSGLWYETAVSPGSVRDPGPAARAKAFLDLALGET